MFKDVSGRKTDKKIVKKLYEQSIVHDGAFKDRRWRRNTACHGTSSGRAPSYLRNNFYTEQNNLLGETQSTKTDCKTKQSKGQKSYRPGLRWEVRVLSFKALNFLDDGMTTWADLPLAVTAIEKTYKPPFAVLRDIPAV